MDSRKWKSVLDYYKWHLCFLLLVVICVVFVLTSLTTSYEADLCVGYIGLQTGYMDTQKFNDNKPDIEKLLKDSTGDGDRYAEIYVYNVNKKKEALNLLEEMIEAEGYHIYIAPKDTFLSHENKSDFATLLTPKGNVETISDSSGRVYAVSLEDNTYIEMLGLRDTTGLYIAAADFKDEKLTDYEKNGINIANFIVESRKNYNK